MFQRVLVALDGSENSRKALYVAVELARTVGANLHALGVEEELPHYAATVGETQEAKEAQNAFFAQVMVEAQGVAAGAGIEMTTEVRAGHAAEQIIRVATEGQFDLVVLGARGQRSLREFLLGTTTDRVLHHVRCSVLVVR